MDWIPRSTPFRQGWDQLADLSRTQPVDASQMSAKVADGAERLPAAGAPRQTLVLLLVTQ